MNTIVQQPLTRQPWFYSIALLCAALLFPDFISFPLCIAAFILACIDAKKRNTHISFGRSGCILLLLLGYAAISTVYSADPINSFGTFWMWVCMFLGFLSVTTVLYDRDRLSTALLCLTVTLGAVGGVTVLQYVLRETFQLPVSSKFWAPIEFAVYDFLHFPIENTDFGERVSGTFNNPNLLATCLIVLLPFCLAYLLGGTPKKIKTPVRICILLAVYALGFSFCRGAYLAMIAVGFLLSLLFIRKKFIVTVLVAIYMVLLVPTSIGNRLISTLPGVSDPAPQTVTTQTDEAQEPQAIMPPLSDRYAHDDSINNRFFIWKQVAVNSLKSPLFGAGFGVGSTQTVLHAANLDFRHAHNLFLELFSEGGIVLLGIFCVSLGLMFSRGVAILWRCKDRHARLLGFAIVAACVSICILGLFDFPLSTPRTILSFMLFTGFAETVARICLQVPVLEPFVPKKRAGSPSRDKKIP